MIIVIVKTYSQKIIPENYIAKYKDLAILEMKRTGVPASISLAQALIESESGNGLLARKSNNHFGIKCSKRWNGKKVKHDDDKKNEYFRAYTSVYLSYIDHSNFLKNKKLYANLFKLNIYDYESWAYGLKKAGYATDKNYDKKIILNIKKYNLYVYDSTDSVEANIVNY